MTRPRITAAAIIYRGTLYTLPPPARHHHIIRHIVETTGAATVDGEQGFVDETGRFLRRKVALVSALVNGQVKDPANVRAGMLFSEDLW